jgi:hypothetical protein
MPKGPFDDEFTPEEEALLKDDTTVPPAEEGGEGSVDDAIAAAQPAAEAPKEGEEPKPAAAAPAEGESAPKPADAAPVVDDEEKALADFLEKNKDKSPEELARLAFQQSKRANKEAAQNRQTRERVGVIAARVKNAAEQRERLATSLPEIKAKFREQLEKDPDAATTALFEALVDNQLSEADAEVQRARVDEAIGFAETHIPEFGKNWPGMHELAREVGYTDDEINAIDDGRPLVTLYLASLAGRLMKSGIMDRFGNIVNVPNIETTPVDPRLSAPDPQRTLGGTGARSTRGSATVEQQLAEIYEMTDEQLNKFERENPGAIDALLKAA